MQWVGDSGYEGFFLSLGRNTHIMILGVSSHTLGPLKGNATWGGNKCDNTFVDLRAHIQFGPQISRRPVPRFPADK